MLKTQVAQMGIINKATYIHDFLINMREHSDTSDPVKYNTLQAMSAKTGVCNNVYTTLFCIFSRSCGLVTGTVVYDMKDLDMKHCYNTIIMDGGSAEILLIFEAIMRII